MDWLFAVFVAILGGIWRVWDGRGANWWPYVEKSRFRLIPLYVIASVAAWIAFADHPGRLTPGIPDALWWAYMVSHLWPPALAVIALQRGFPVGTWESYKKSLLHWTAPVALMVLPLVAWGAVSPWTIIPAAVIAAIPGVLYPWMYPKDWALTEYLPEFSAGFAMILIVGIL